MIDSESRTRMTEHGVPRSNIHGSYHVYISKRKLDQTNKTKIVKEWRIKNKSTVAPIRSMILCPVSKAESNFIHGTYLKGGHICERSILQNTKSIY